MATERLGAGLKAGGGILREFRTFLLRGNVVDLAVGVVIGVAFTGVVQALVKDLITPLIAAIGAKPDFGTLAFTLNHSLFRYGDFLNALLSFVIIAGVVFFLVVMPVNHLVALSQRNKAAPPVTTRECPECLSRIPLEARRCAYCTAEVVPVGADAPA
ncbi:MAG: large conductance mechanosensitive channel protein MscL [Chloroflexi bacterium]|nr:MAG: large conductance mechanosensitive channel protein MscL [Chloroflexota bacterium]